MDLEKARAYHAVSVLMKYVRDEHDADDRAGRDAARLTATAIRSRHSRSTPAAVPRDRDRRADVLAQRVAREVPASGAVDAEGCAAARRASRANPPM
jgi:hypothetical protein